MVNTLICIFAFRHCIFISAFLPSTISRVVGKNIVIGAGEGRSRSALNSSSLMEEGLEEVLSQSPDILERERYLPLDYVLKLSLQDKFPFTLVFTVDYECS